ncbi:MAG: hypothetical protein ACLRNQ_22215 [Flavonifractor plautii]
MMIQSMDRFIVGPRSAEGAIVAICILLNVATGLNTAAIVGTGPWPSGWGRSISSTATAQPTSSSAPAAPSTT